MSLGMANPTGCVRQSGGRPLPGPRPAAGSRLAPRWPGLRYGATDEERRSRDGHDGLCVVLLESTAMDSDKHARLLELVIQRLAARAQRAAPLARRAPTGFNVERCKSYLALKSFWPSSSAMDAFAWCDAATVWPPAAACGVWSRAMSSPASIPSPRPVRNWTRSSAYARRT